MSMRVCMYVYTPSSLFPGSTESAAKTNAARTILCSNRVSHYDVMTILEWEYV